MIKFTFLSENKTDNPGCVAEHGLSIYIEADNKKILFDTGASDLLLDNAKHLSVDLKAVDSVIISHGHYDHTEGLPKFCEINKEAKIYIHKEAFHSFYGMENNILDKEPCGILWDEASKKDILKQTILTEGILKLSEDVVISGTIPNIEGVEPPERFFIKEMSEKGEVLIEDPLAHEQFLAIRDRNVDGSSRGIYVFSGCSHKGVTPVLEYVKEIFKEEKIIGLIAGMHLYSADEKTRKKTIDEILEAKVEMIMPVHCTGIKAICDLKTAMGEACIVATTGDTYEYK